MKNEIIYENLLRELKNRIPEHPKLVTHLCNILIIEKEAVYRRLNKQVPFSFQEVATISSSLNLSLDSIIGETYENRMAFYLITFEFINPLEKDIKTLEKYIEILERNKKEESIEIAFATNTLPRNIYLTYPNLANFHLFKWHYNNSSPGEIINFNKIKTDKRMDKVNQDFVNISHNAKTTTYIFDPFIFQYLVNDIKFFGSIGWLSEENVKNLKEELLQLCQYTENIADEGMYTDTNKPVAIYISNINLEASYCCIKLAKQELSFVKAFTFNSIISVEKKSIEKMRKWIQSLKRVSTMISVSGEIQRKDFFNKQIEFINTNL